MKTLQHTITRMGLTTLLCALLLSSLICGTAITGISGEAHAAQPDDGPDKNLTVEIVDQTVPTPTPTPSESTTTPGNEGTPSSPEGAPPATESGPPGTGKLPPMRSDTTISTPTLTQETITDSSEADRSLGNDAKDSGGLLYLSGLTPSSSHSLHPSGGAVTLEVSVRNISTQTIDGTIDFWITTLWGWRMSEHLGSEVVGLAPGETRKLTATLSGPGQWALYEAHATFTPPETIDGAETPPMQRDHFLFVLPYFALAITAALVLLYIAYRYWRRRVAAGEVTAE